MEKGYLTKNLTAKRKEAMQLSGERGLSGIASARVLRHSCAWLVTGVVRELV